MMAMLATGINIPNKHIKDNILLTKTNQSSITAPNKLIKARVINVICIRTHTRTRTHKESETCQLTCFCGAAVLPQQHYLIALARISPIDRHGLSTCNRAAAAPYLDAKLCVTPRRAACLWLLVVLVVVAAFLRTGVDCPGERLRLPIYCQLLLLLLFSLFD